jgi:hypothetical protein
MCPFSKNAEDLSSAYRQIGERVRAAAAASARDPAAITLIAVSKKQPVQRLESLYRLGHRDFGENYAQEMLEKAEALDARGCPGIRWHFIGHLQTNKAKTLVSHVHAVHSVDSEKLARELAKRWRARTPPRTDRLPVFIEVNLGRETEKSGATSESTESLARFIAEQPELELRGLMCVPETDLPSERLSARFSELRELELRCRPMSGGALSMGMSNDFELAIAQGATHVRVGTALFGART